MLDIAVQNIEPVLHDFTIEQIDAYVHISYLGGTGEHAHAEASAQEADVHFVRKGTCSATAGRLCSGLRATLHDSPR